MKNMYLFECSKIILVRWAPNYIKLIQGNFNFIFFKMWKKSQNEIVLE